MMTDTPEAREAPPAAAPPAPPEFSAAAIAAMDDVYRFARSLTRDPSDAEDVVQDTYLRAFRSWRTFQPGTDIRRWLFTIARNAFLRSRERGQREVALDEDASAAAEASQAQEAWVRGGLDPILDRADLGPAITKALAELPESFRSVVVLVDIEDQPYEAAAEVLGVPVGTVRSRLFRGRKLLQQSLAQYARDAGLVAASPSRSPA
jgi:RNA polymerase sigma-70 factor (ECF subfamily)